MGPIETFCALPPADRFMKFVELCNDPAAVQREVLFDILRRNAPTAFGRAHDFATMGTVDDYRTRVPARDWSAFEAYGGRTERGVADVLFAGVPKVFIMSSGTTGKAKHLPESALGSLAKDVTSFLRQAVLTRFVSLDATESSFLPFSNAAELSVAECGIPIGSASGLTLMSTPAAIRQRMAFPVEALRCTDAESLDYIIIRFALERDVAMIIGNSPMRMASFFERANARRDELIGDIAEGRLSKALDLSTDLRGTLESSLSGPNAERATTLRHLVDVHGRLAPMGYWPNLKVASYWLSGSVGSHAKALASWIGDSPTLIDCGYGASEGKFNIPLEPGHPEGPLNLLGYFFEFVPVSGGAPLLLHELADGEAYEMIVTSYSGLYRYALHDIVRVRGFFGKTPQLFFESKTRDFANVNGEKIAGANILRLVRELTEASPATFVHGAIVANVQSARYDIALEATAAQGLDEQWLARFDAELSERELLYRLFRAQGFIRPPRLLIMGSGWQKALVAHHTPKGGAANQVKLPIVYGELPCADWLERRVGEFPSTPS